MKPVPEKKIMQIATGGSVKSSEIAETIKMIPDFLKNRVNKEESESVKLIRRYDDEIGDDLDLASVILTEAEIVETLKECLKTGKHFDEVLNLGELDEDDLS